MNLAGGWPVYFLFIYFLKIYIIWQTIIITNCNIHEITGLKILTTRDICHCGIQQWYYRKLLSLSECHFHCWKHLYGSEWTIVIFMCYTPFSYLKSVTGMTGGHNISFLSLSLFSCFCCFGEGGSLHCWLLWQVNKNIKMCFCACLQSDRIVKWKLLSCN